MSKDLVHVSELGADYFHFDATKHQMLGERTGKRYRLGDRVKVKVVRVDMESTKIDFVLESVTASRMTGTLMLAHGVRPRRRKPKQKTQEKRTESKKAGKRHG